MECKVYDENKLNEASDEEKDRLKQMIVLHAAGTKCGNCGEGKMYLAHSCDNGVWKHVCCDCVAARENWTGEKHRFEHERALMVDLITMLMHTEAAAAAAEDTDDEMPELEDVNGNVAQ